MSVAMPTPDTTVLARRERIVAALRAIVPGEGVIAAEREMRPYEFDGLTAYRQLPMVVVLPETTQQVSRVLAFCHAQGVKVVPRGAGTSLSGGALPLVDGVLLGMAKFNRIREIDFENRVAVVEPGVTNLPVTQAVEHAGFYYVPDPSSQIACTIGGNVAEVGRRALPQIRHDHQQPAGVRAGADDGRDRPRRRQASRCQRLRSPRRHHRLRGTARRGDRDHRARS